MNPSDYPSALAPVEQTQLHQAVEPHEAPALATRHGSRVFRSTLLLGAGILVCFGILGVFSPLLAPYAPTALNPLAASQDPSWSHPLGTDNLGMDVLSRIMYAPRIDFLVAFAVTLISVATGTLLGAVVGYVGGWLDVLVMRVADSLQAFPVLIVAMAAVGVLSQRTPDQAATVAVVVLVIALVQSPSYLRLVRAQVLSLRTRDFVEAAHALGAPTRSVIFKHVLPNALTPVYPTAAQNAGYAILLTAGMAFVGIGVTAPTPEWGSMISIGAQYLVTGQWWMSFFPGAAIALAILGFTLVSDGLQDLASPQQRHS